MIQISKDSFFAAIGSQDVVTSLADSPRYDNVTGYVTKWETRGRTLLGKSDGGTVFMPHRYFVTEQVFNKGNFERVSSI
jgi:hypothetical protein